MGSLLRTVAVVGVDGSGKSTQAILLRQDLSRDGAQVVMIHPLGWKFLWITVPAGPAPFACGEGASVGRTVRRIIALAELADISLYLWSTHLWYLAVAVTRRRVVWIVSDRSAADVLIKQWRRCSLPEPLLKFWYRVVPRPQLTIWLHTDPAVAAHRDTEFPLSYYEEFHELYERASKRFRWQVVTSSHLTVQGVRHEISQIMREHFGLGDT
jgi:dTMP kinase